MAVEQGAWVPGRCSTKRILFLLKPFILLNDFLVMLFGPASSVDFTSRVTLSRNIAGTVARQTVPAMFDKQLCLSNSRKLNRKSAKPKPKVEQKVACQQSQKLNRKLLVHG